MKQQLLVSQRIRMDGDSSQSNLCEWAERLLVNWNLLQVIQCLPAVYHPGNEGRGGSHDGTDTPLLGTHLPMMVYFMSR